MDELQKKLNRRKALNGEGEQLETDFDVVKKEAFLASSTSASSTTEELRLKLERRKALAEKEVHNDVLDIQTEVTSSSRNSFKSETEELRIKLERRKALNEREVNERDESEAASPTTSKSKYQLETDELQEKLARRRALNGEERRMADDADNESLGLIDGEGTIDEIECLKSQEGQSYQKSSLEEVKSTSENNEAVLIKTDGRRKERKLYQKNLPNYTTERYYLLSELEQVFLTLTTCALE